jgi:bacillopeptidase F
MNNGRNLLGGGLFLSSMLSFGCGPSGDDLSGSGGPRDGRAGGPTLADVLRTAAPNDRIPVIVTLADRVDVRAFADADKHARRANINRALQTKADESQAALRAFLQERGATRVTPLWVVNGIAATVTPSLASALATYPGVRRVTLNSTLRAPTEVALPSALGLSAAPVPEWNITAVDAPSVWSLGYRGAGAVVANMDTGVDVAHSDLGSRWRGGSDSWYDPYRNTSTPYDAIGHGTETMGIMVGGAAGGTAIGVAPDATWIAAKIYDDNGNTTVSVIHEAFQWLLAPSGHGAPDVVEASWGLEAVDACDDTFASDFEALRAAGIVVVFAAGNAGPSPLTSVSPANDVDGFSTGAVDDTDTVAYLSSRGPSACTGGTFPTTVAPGVNVKTSAISLGGVPQYTYVTGTSFSAPHVAGAAALLAGAFASAAEADIEKALRSTARDLGPVGPDNDYGYGLVDAYAAFRFLAAQAPPPSITFNQLVLDGVIR